MKPLILISELSTNLYISAVITTVTSEIKVLVTALIVRVVFYGLEYAFKKYVTKKTEK